MIDPLKPSASLLAKLGSIVVHVEEGFSSEGHQFDIEVFRTITYDPEVVEWMEAMDSLALIPKKR